MKKIAILLKLIRLTYRKTRITGDDFLMGSLRLIYLLLFKKFSPSEIMVLAPHLPSQIDGFPVLISKQNSLEKLERINDPKLQFLTENKDIFYQVCRENNLPVPRHLLTGGEGDPYLEQLEALLMALEGEAQVYNYFPEHFIKKDRNGAYASGFEMFHKQDGHFTSALGDIYSAPQLIEMFADKTKPPCIVQEQVNCHKKLAELTGTHIAQCARIVTINVGEKKARASFFIMKLVSGGNLIDNYSGGYIGNMLAYGDLKTGTLEAAIIGADEGMGHKNITRHPDTNRELPGFEIPFWQESLELACKAHDIFSQFGLIGWDIAITEDGPVILEGNVWQDPPRCAPHVMSKCDWELIFT